MPEFNAAREQDEIAHTASEGWMIAGAIGGALIAAAAIAVTGGAALVAVSAVAAGACTGGGLGELMGSMSWAPRHTTGQLILGSPNVYINNRPAIRAHLSTGACDEHNGSPQRVAEGSEKVSINSYPAARIGDRLTCSAEIYSGSANVFIGGDKAQTDEISPEIPEWVNWAMMGIGGATLAVLASPAIAILGTLGGMGGGYGGGYIGGALFGEGSDGQKWMMLAGSLAGGAAGARSGMRFDAWRSNSVNQIKLNVRREYLNKKFNRTGNINKDINIRANKDLVDNFMRVQGIDESKINALRTGIDLNERVTIETLNRGKMAYQNQSPGNWQGNWYSLNKNTPPTKLGINPEGQVRGTKDIVMKEIKTYQLQRKTEVLRSIATPALDTWSVPGKPFQTEGGGIQWFSTEKNIWVENYE